MFGATRVCTHQRALDGQQLMLEQPRHQQALRAAEVRVARDERQQQQEQGSAEIAELHPAGAFKPGDFLMP